jgi:hypothetical protein
VHDALAKDRLHARNEMAVFGTHPYERSSGLARGFPDSHHATQECRSSSTAAAAPQRLEMQPGAAFTPLIAPQLQANLNRGFP